jgi:hypothetical protein
VKRKAEKIRVHDLKVLPEFFNAVFIGDKTFEVRRNDRGFKVGDVLNLREYELGGERYTGRALRMTVSYILEGAELSVIPDGYCVMSIYPASRRRAK